MKVKDVLARKGSGVTTIRPSASITELLGILAEHRIGAAVVVEGDAVAGIVSERDVVRALNDSGAGLLEQPVRAIMTTEVSTCGPDDEVRALARTMTERRFRHMPVLEEGKLAGIVTIGDIVKVRIDELETEQEQLTAYISG